MIKKFEKFSFVFNKKVLIIGIFSLLIISGVLACSFLKNEKSVSTKSASTPVKIVPLSSVQKEKVISTLIESDFIKDIPEDYPIALRFYDFHDGKRVWQDGFLIGNNKLLKEGTPAIYLSLHSKYIDKIHELGICETIKLANENKDLGFNSEYGKTSLLIKYSSLIKHKECFGF